LGDEYSCATAIKGADYIHLLNEAGVMIAAFDEIKDFSGFKLTNGSYTSPAADHDCYLAVLRDDGTIGRGGHKCSDIPQTAADVGALASGGGTLSGNVTVAKSGYPAFVARDTKTGRTAQFRSEDGRTAVINGAHGDDNNRAILFLNQEGADLNTLLSIYRAVNGTGTMYQVIHTGNVAANGIAKVETGSYVGTDTYGSGNQTSLKFSAKPKLLFVKQRGGAEDWILATADSAVACSLHNDSNGEFYNVYLSWAENGTVAWYAAASAHAQLNQSENTYDYFAVL
jgi:hypothetical protein